MEDFSKDKEGFVKMLNPVDYEVETMSEEDTNKVTKVLESLKLSQS